MCGKFHDYLYGASFVVVTDNPLTYLLTTAKLDAASHRWLAALSTYTFRLQYRAGKQNLDADALSRRPHSHSADLAVQKDLDLINRFTESGELEELDSDIVSPSVAGVLLPVSPAAQWRILWPWSA